MTKAVTLAIDYSSLGFDRIWPLKIG